MIGLTHFLPSLQSRVILVYYLPICHLFHFFLSAVCENSFLLGLLCIKKPFNFDKVKCFGLQICVISSQS